MRTPDGAGQSNSAVDTEDESRIEESELTWSWENWLLIVLFVGLSVVGIAISTGAVQPGLVDVSAADWNSPVSVPLFVYLYASLGALGYIFTRLITRLEDFVHWGDIEKLVEMALRIPAACILAAGVYLFLPLFDPQADGLSGPWFAAGMAFLVGLYVNVAFKALGGLAERLLGRAVGSDRSESRPTTETGQPTADGNQSGTADSTDRRSSDRE
jgi:hypothetical protein